MHDAFSCDAGFVSSKGGLSGCKFLAPDHPSCAKAERPSHPEQKSAGPCYRRIFSAEDCEPSGTCLLFFARVRDIHQMPDMAREIPCGWGTDEATQAD